MTSREKLYNEYIPIIAMACILLLVQILAITLAIPMEIGEMQAFEDPESAANPLYYIVLILVFTGIILLSIKKNMQWIIQAIILLAVMSTLYFVTYVILSMTAIAPTTGLMIAAAVALLLTGLLYAFPEWYVIDIVGLVIAAGASAIFGISLAIIPVIILLVILAVYDAISVYRTKHMLNLADGAIDMKLPIMFVIPKRLNYSFRNETAETRKSDEVFFMGLGDAVIPTILVVSAYIFVDHPGIPYPVIGAMIGTLVAYLILTVLVMKGKPHAGLPFLNTGVIAGYILGSLIAGTPIL